MLMIEFPIIPDESSKNLSRIFRQSLENRILKGAVSASRDLELIRALLCGLSILELCLIIDQEKDFDLRVDQLSPCGTTNSFKLKPGLKIFNLGQTPEGLDISPLTNNELAGQSIALSRVLNHLKGIDPAQYAEIGGIVREVIFCKGHQFYGLSDRASIGRLYIGSPSDQQLREFGGDSNFRLELFIGEQLIHENAHNVLMMAEALNQLYRNPNRHSIYSPLRHQKRSDQGVFHAFFVLSRLLHFYHQILASGPEEFRRPVEYRLGRIRSDFDYLAQEIARERKDIFTPTGHLLFQKILNHNSIRMPHVSQY